MLIHDVSGQKCHGTQTRATRHIDQIPHRRGRSRRPPASAVKGMTTNPNSARAVLTWQRGTDDRSDSAEIRAMWRRITGVDARLKAASR